MLWRTKIKFNGDRNMIQKIFALILAFIFPPLGVLASGGSFNALVLNIILTVLFYVPGLIHALYVIFRDEVDKSI